MSTYKPGDHLNLFFATYSSGVLATPDDTPTATLVHNGVDDDAVALTLTSGATGRFEITGTIPSSGYASGDRISVRVDATMDDVPGECFPLQVVLDGERNSDVQAHGDTSWSTATGFASSSQATSILSAIANLNNLSALANVFGPGGMVPPATGSVAYSFVLTIRDSEGILVVPDATPTIGASNLANTNMSARVSALSNPSTGVYGFTYSVESGDLGGSLSDEISFVATAAVGGSPRRSDAKIILYAAEPLTAIASILSIVQQIQFDGSNNVKAIIEAYASGQDPATLLASSFGTVTAQTGKLQFDGSNNVKSNLQVNSDKTGYALTTPEHLLISGTDVPAGLTTQGYNAARAGYLDVLNGLVPAIWAVAASALTSAGSIGAYLLGKLSTGFSVRLCSPVLQDGSMSLVQGDFYTASLGRAPIWTISNYGGPAVADVIVTFEILDARDYHAGTGLPTVSLTGSASMTGSTATFTVDIPGGVTAALPSSPPQSDSNFVYQMKFVYESADVTIALGGLTIARRVG